MGRKHLRSRWRRLDGDEGIDYVRCRICGDDRRVISGRHLSKHDTDRETHMAEYHLTPDELIAKAFRLIQSSRPGYHPHGKRDWIAQIKSFYVKDGKVLPNTCNSARRIYTGKACGFLATRTKPCEQLDSTLEGCGCARSGNMIGSSKKRVVCVIRIYPLYANYVM